MPLTRSSSLTQRIDNKTKNSSNNNNTHEQQIAKRSVRESWEKREAHKKNLSVLRQQTNKQIETNVCSLGAYTQNFEEGKKESNQLKFSYAHIYLSSSSLFRWIIVTSFVRLRNALSGILLIVRITSFFFVCRSVYMSIEPK